MGTPEFPDLGKHCSVEDCKQIDFLPFTCDRCQLVYCLEHRTYTKHHCSKQNIGDVTVSICPLCATGVRLNPNEDPNITWENHVNTDCDPSNYDKVTKKRKCPVAGCRETLTFSNTIRCRDCAVDHCLKHRFGLDHKCPGPKKPDGGLLKTFLINMNKREEQPRHNYRAPSVPSTSSKWTGTIFNAVSSVRATAEASVARFSNEVGQRWQFARDGVGGQNGKMERCLQCGATFSLGSSLVDHVERVHGDKTRVKVTIDACPKCSKGFPDPMSLMEHLDRDHGGTSKA